MRSFLSGSVDSDPGNSGTPRLQRIKSVTSGKNNRYVSCSKHKRNSGLIALIALITLMSLILNILDFQEGLRYYLTFFQFW